MGRGGGKGVGVHGAPGLECQPVAAGGHASTPASQPCPRAACHRPTILRAHAAPALACAAVNQLAHPALRPTDTRALAAPCPRAQVHQYDIVMEVTLVNRTNEMLQVREGGLPLERALLSEQRLCV